MDVNVQRSIIMSHINYMWVYIQCLYSYNGPGYVGVCYVLGRHKLRRLVSPISRDVIGLVNHFGYTYNG